MEGGKCGYHDHESFERPEEPVQPSGKGADNTDGYCAKREEEGRPFTTHNEIGALNLEGGRERDQSIIKSAANI